MKVTVFWQGLPGQLDCASRNCDAVLEAAEGLTAIPQQHLRLWQRGRLMSGSEELFDHEAATLRLRLCGGKGGFGSLLRALGNKRSHAETDNIDACRDLSGRRLRDVNDEKKIKQWLKEQAEKEDEVKARRQAKLERAVAVPKHAFDDHSFHVELDEKSRLIADAVKAAAAAGHVQAPVASEPPKRKTAALQDEWDSDDVSDSDEEEATKSDSTQASSAAASGGEPDAKKNKEQVDAK